MTDKQIIINKMDKPKRYCEGIDCAWCNEKEPCIYKIANELEEKLLRKEQECEKFKEEQAEIKKYLGINYKTILERLEELTEFRDRDREEILQLEEQLDQLKADREEVLKQLEFVRTLNTVKETEIRKLTKTFVEIKEIVEKFCSEICPYKDDEYDICVEDCFLDEIVNPILQKISEVENGR